MIIWKKGNLFTSTANVLVNTINCEGAMGKGIALEFKKRYPDMYNQYKTWCKTYHPKGGDLFWWPKLKFEEKIHTVCKSFVEPEQKPINIILNFATKESWRNKSKIEWIEIGLKNFVDVVNIDKLHIIDTVAFPKLGCNNGGLDWETQVKPLMIKYLEPLNITIEIYE